jgi:Asp-tRNA(Asn)/Glu-tRNA(Gln) amidotransferase C subunit
MSHIQFEIEELKAIATDISHVLGFVSLSDKQTELRKYIVNKINETVNEHVALQGKLYSNSKVRADNIKRLQAEAKECGRELTMDMLSDMQFLGVIDKDYNDILKVD